MNALPPHGTAARSPAAFDLLDASLRTARHERLGSTSQRIPLGVTAVIGPSGSGKTSLLDLLVGFERPTSGRVVGHLGTPAWVPADDGLWPQASVADHLAHVGADAATTEALLREFGLEGRREARPSALSRGEAARLAVARALATGARVLVMDEPLAHVDPARCRRTWDVLLRRVAATRATLVFATHDPSAVLRAAEHVVHLEHGRVTWAGRTEELYRRPPSHPLALALGAASWFDDARAARFFGRALPHPCVRPEQVEVVPDAAGDVEIDFARPLGPVTELELRHAGGDRVELVGRSTPGLVSGARVRLHLLPALLMVLALLGGCGPKTPELEFATVQHLAIPPDGPRAPAPRAIAPGAGGELIVLDNAGRVLVLDATGVVQRSWRMPDVEAGNPEGVCRLANGRIVVADTHYHRLVVFDPAGEVLATIGSHGTGPGQFLYPVRVVEDPDGFLYVAEYGSNDRVQKLTPSGDYVLEFGRFGTAPGELQRATGLVWHDEHLYVADAVNQRVQVFAAADGAFLRVLPVPDLAFPYDLALGPNGLLWVAEYGAGRVTALTLDGALVGRFGRPGTGAGELSTPWALTAVQCGAEVCLWICDTGNRRLVRATR